MDLRVAGFYRFVPIEDVAALREQLLGVAAAAGIRGTILVAPEGINATIAGPDQGVEAVLAHLRSDPRFAGLTTQESRASIWPFGKLKVRPKKEIVTMGVPGTDPRRGVGAYVEPEGWNELIEAEDVVLIDVRNHFEVELGTFRGAVDPQTGSFGDFPAFVRAHPELRSKRVAMFCTGGIRCEKATAWMLDEGFEQVYHLKGGILKYLERIDPGESTWVGDCFVFDERELLGHGLAESGPDQSNM